LTSITASGKGSRAPDSTIKGKAPDATGACSLTGRARIEGSPPRLSIPPQTGARRATQPGSTRAACPPARQKLAVPACLRTGADGRSVSVRPARAHTRAGQRGPVAGASSVRGKTPGAWPDELLGQVRRRRGVEAARGAPRPRAQPARLRCEFDVRVPPSDRGRQPRRASPMPDARIAPACAARPRQPRSWPVRQTHEGLVDPAAPRPSYDLGPSALHPEGVTAGIVMRRERQEQGVQCLALGTVER
jgi:hypothetical protein